MGNQPSPLRKAIRWSEIDQVRAILDQAGNDGAAKLINDDYSPDCIMDSCSRATGNALYYAVCRNRIEIVAILLDHGGDPYSSGMYGETCLHAAAKSNYVDVGRILLSHGMDMMVTDDNGGYPIHSAAGSIFDTSSFVEFLLDEARDPDYVNATNFSGQTPLHRATISGNDAVIRTLLSRGANANATDKYGNTPLHVAMKNASVWHLLVQHGADISMRNADGKTPEQVTR